MRDFVKYFTEEQVDNIHCPSLITAITSKNFNLFYKTLLATQNTMLTLPIDLMLYQMRVNPSPKNYFQ